MIINYKNVDGHTFPLCYLLITQRKMQIKRSLQLSYFEPSVFAHGAFCCSIPSLSPKMFQESWSHTWLAVPDSTRLVMCFI